MKNLKTQKKVLSTLGALFVGVFLGACAGTFKGNINFNPAEPLRVAILPFQVLDKNGQPVEAEGRLLLDNLALVSTKQEENPAQIVRRLVIGELGKSGLDLVSNALIDVDLPHHGYAKENGTIDTLKVWKTSPIELCQSFLNCDAILYGSVTRWDRSYYGIQSVNTVGIDLKLISAKDRSELFSAHAEDSESRGLTKGPTGLSSLILEPIKGLDSDIIVGLAQRTVKKMLEPLDVKKRPQFLESSPPSIFATSHDAHKGELKRSQPLVVLAFGSDKQFVSFSIGNAVEAVPMIELSQGHYYGEYLPLPGDTFARQAVKVTMTDNYGRSTSVPVPGSEVSLN